MRILVIDNYDSFTYNLVHLLEACSNHTVEVKLNNKVNVAEAKRFSKILLSPGPGLPAEAGNMPEIIKALATEKNMFGVCLGWQAIAENFSMPLKNLPTVFHGIATPITVTKQDLLFQNCPATFNVGRYHSWVADETRVPNDMEITAVDAVGSIMAGRHKQLAIRGVQFHPESILSEYGKEIISNWLKS